MSLKEHISKNDSRKTFAQSSDSLTGLLNSDVFQIILEWESARSRRYGTSFTLALLNIDSFSLYNKQNGKSKGDAILKKIAQITKNTIRRCDSAMPRKKAFKILKEKANKGKLDKKIVGHFIEMIGET